jgi:hypothetical protein
VNAARLHHVGLVVHAIAALAQRSACQLHGGWGGHIIHDPLQNVRVSFLAGNGPDALWTLNRERLLVEWLEREPVP